MLRQRAREDAEGRVHAVKDEKAGQHDPWIAMLQALMVPIYRWIYTRMGNREQAEQLTARVVDTAIRERYERRNHSLDVPTSEALRVRLCQIARAVVADELHATYGEAARALVDRMNRMSAEDMERMAADDTVHASLAAARMNGVLSRLPAREREVLTCRFLMGYPIERTAAQMHLSVPETLALQFVALRHASQLDDAARGGEQEHAQERELEPETETAPKVLEGCGCR